MSRRRSAVLSSIHVLTSLPAHHSGQLDWYIFLMSQPTPLFHHLLLLSMACMNLCWSCGATLASGARGPDSDLSVARVPESWGFFYGWVFDLSDRSQGSVTRLWGRCSKSCQTIIYLPRLSGDSLIVRGWRSIYILSKNGNKKKM